MLRRLVLLLLGLCALGAPLCAAQRGPDSADLRRARERWERLTPGQKEEARERYERYLALSEEGRRELRERAERLREAREAHVRALPTDVRRELSGLAPEKRREIVDELFRAEAGERGRELRGRMPEDLLARLERARPEERPELLRRFRDQQRGRVARSVIGALGPGLGLAPGEVSRLQELPPDERLRAAFELQRRHEAGRAGDRPAGGGGEEPFGLDAEGWRRMAELPPEEFLRRVREHRERRLRELGIDAPPGAAPEGRPLAAHAARLAQAMRLDPREALELAALAAPERRAELLRRRRERCMQVLRASALLPDERLRELEALDESAFFGIVRELVGRAHERPDPPGHERRGRGAAPGPEERRPEDARRPGPGPRGRRAPRGDLPSGGRVD